MKTKFYTVPGYGGSGEDHWQTYFETKLDNCYRINQDRWTKPILKEWVAKIEEYLSGEDLSNVILITHSLGGIALAHWVQEQGQTLKGALIVAPPDLEHPPENFGLEKFLPIPQTKLPFPTIMVCSSNDKWMTLERAQLLAKTWGSELTIIDNAGHINGDSGYGEWDSGLDILDKLV